MKPSLTLSSVVILCLALLVQYNEAQTPRPFVSVCNSYISDEIFYTGQCSLRFPWNLLGEVQEHINNADDTWTIYRFIKEYFLIGIDNFYRETYYDINDPIDLVDSLDALIIEGLEFLDRFLDPGCLTNIQVVEFTQPFYDSGFNQSRLLVVQTFYEKFPESSSCGSGSDIGLCPRTRDILDLNTIVDFYDRSVDNLVRSFSQAIYDKYTNSLHIPGKNALENLLSKVDALGIDGASVAELKAFTNSPFYQGIRDYYLNDTVSTTKYVRPTTEKTTRAPSTTRERVIDAKAIDDLVLYLIPSLLVLFGILGAVAIVAIVYRFRPVVIEVYPRPANANNAKMESKNEAIQMEKLPDTKF